ncbi:hypothetical protein [Photobacterium carnosum]|uniref:hypothetical protein n=1 Tax=Photobacterium carnosum TaxID=2023717 RepID=UPI001E3D0F35|nr:hypothetical protein [Photobacterium carnosum]MCD9500340.1 hypothetical protein [Photobacterium carnosum]
MTTFKIYLLFFLLSNTFIIHCYANNQGRSEILISGYINSENICTLNINGPSSLDSGSINISDLNPNGGILTGEMKNFNASILCTMPTKIALKFSSSLGSDNAYKLGIYKTNKNKEAAHIYADIGKIKPTTDGILNKYAAIGNRNLNPNTLIVVGPLQYNSEPEYQVISGVQGNKYNIYSPINTNYNLKTSTSFNLPFRLGIFSENVNSGWTNDIIGTSFSLSSTVTVELFSI